MDKHFRLVLPDEGYDIYTPRVTQGWGYRYGPSIMVHDGICEAWFASPGCAGEADWFTYRKSTDGGNTWSDEKVVLMPTADSMDWFSVCDPAVIKYGGYYYIGYTSTLFSHGGGVCNNAFVARSRCAEGPYEKWTSGGWGEKRGDCSWVGSPAPILYFDEHWGNWGTGEPSFVVKDDVLYIYSTWTSKRADGSLYHMTRVATADITREDWPATVENRGIACFRTGGSNDSFDVVYCEDLDKFVAISTDKRFSPDSMLAIYESDDGFTFSRVNEIKVNTGFMCHNSGISGDCLHHIKSGDLMLLGYAYGDSWGCWGTRFHRYSFEAMDEPFYSEDRLENVKRKVIKTPVPEKLWPIAVTSIPHCFRLNRGCRAAANLVWLDTMYNTHAIPAKELSFDNYDGNVIGFDADGNITAVGEGYSYADAHWNGITLQFKVNVYGEDTDLSEENKKVTAFYPVWNDYHINIGQNELKEIRGIAEYANGTWFEVCGDRYDISDNLAFGNNGNIYAKEKGEDFVKVSLGEYSFTVKVVAE